MDTQTVSDLMELLAPDETAIKELERENPYVSVSLKHHLDPYDPYKRSVRLSHFLYILSGGILLIPFLYYI